MAKINAEKQERFRTMMKNRAKGYPDYVGFSELLMERKQSEFYACLFGLIAEECPKALKPVLKAMSEIETDRYEDEPFYAIDTAQELCSVVETEMVVEEGMAAADGH